MPPVRNPRLAKVHIARKELGLDEPTYRAVLMRVTALESSGACTDAQLDAVMEEFKRLGWTPRQTRPPLSTKPHVRLIWALWGELKPHLRDGSAKALRSFCQRQTGVTDPEWLDGRQANVVTEALKAWIKRVQSEAKTTLEPAMSDV